MEAVCVCVCVCDPSARSLLCTLLRLPPSPHLRTRCGRCPKKTRETHPIQRNARASLYTPMPADYMPIAVRGKAIFSSFFFPSFFLTFPLAFPCADCSGKRRVVAEAWRVHRIMASSVRVACLKFAAPSSPPPFFVPPPPSPPSSPLPSVRFACHLVRWMQGSTVPSTRNSLVTVFSRSHHHFYLPLLLPFSFPFPFLLLLHVDPPRRCPLQILHLEGGRAVQGLSGRTQVGYRGANQLL